MKIRARVKSKSSIGNGQRFANLAASAAISARKEPEAPGKKARERLALEQLFFLNFIAPLGRRLFTLLVIAASTWPTIGTGASLQEISKRSGRVRTDEIRLSGLDPQHQYSLLYSISALESLGPDTRVIVEIAQGNAILGAKTLHAGDADFYTQFRVPRNGDAVVRVRAAGAQGDYRLQVNRWPLTHQVKSGPNRDWRHAMSIPLGRTIFASGDDAEYIPLPGTTRRSVAADKDGEDWYRFEFREKTPKLIFFQIELMDRDQLPANVSVYRISGGKPSEYFEGEDPVTLPHEVQALPGNKFTPRILKDSGTYYIAVRARHPEYKLRTRIYDPPPYSDPQVAVRTALDYILGAGDSWHANTPRRGGILDRVASVHQETSLCVACHTTHFPLRAQLYAVRNGYPVVQRQQLQFLCERFYNNPRPFYGFEPEGAVWARVISAPANVLGRMSHLLDIFEQEITGERRQAFHHGVAAYLNLYYAGRGKLPADETNGNSPLVSAHEVAWYAWSATKDPHLPKLIAEGEITNVADLCYQTLALADIDVKQYGEQIRKNAERILALQRPDGQWSMRFEVSQPEVEFQTGHALWALHAAGVPVSNPRVTKAIQYLLARQQAFGGWMDPLQSFENFRTPFRETQMAILALSSYFPKTGRVRGWNSARIERLSGDPVAELEQLDEVWDAPNPAVRKQIVSETNSNDALLRQAAIEALGRIGQCPDTAFLGDASKMVQRTAAWAIRQAHSRHTDLPIDDVRLALASSDDRTRWGATRIFAAHFSALAGRPELAGDLERLTQDRVPTVRMAAAKGLWQFWFWSPEASVKQGIDDALLTALGRPQHPWVRQNLHHAIYNLADENIRYLYNNWVPLLAEQADRERAIRGRLQVESELAKRFSDVLDRGAAAQKKELLRALTELPLRRADVYDLDANLEKPSPPVYNRIGNDTEQIVFFGESAERFAKSLDPLLDSEDAELRMLAERAVLLVRETRFGEVSRLAGPAGSYTKRVAQKLESRPEAAEVVHALKPPPVTVRAAKPDEKPAAKFYLNETYFRGYVQPIFEKRGKDGYACIHCHATHTQFNGTFDTASNVINLADPEKSLLLLKPTSTSESEGVAGANTISHGGGVRWSKDSPEYRTILEWIKGAKE